MRNSWKLCNTHQNCSRCSYALTCWKNKANKHAANAQSLKYMLTSVMDGRTVPYPRPPPTSDSRHQQFRIDPVPQRGTHRWKKCGICLESITFGGDHNTIVFPCGHNICLKCFNNLRNPKLCPFCREPITRGYRLFEEDQEETQDN